MSIIFEKLKDLKGDTFGQGPERLSLEQDQDIYTFRKMIFSPKGMLFVLLAVSCFAFVSFYSLSILKSMLDSGSKEAIVVEHRHHTAGVRGETGEDEDVAPGEEGPGPADDSAQGPAGQKADPEPEPFKVPEYFVIKARKPALEDRSGSIYHLLEKKKEARPVDLAAVIPAPVLPAVNPIDQPSAPRTVLKTPAQSRTETTPKPDAVQKETALNAEAEKKRLAREKEAAEKREQARRMAEKKSQQISRIASLAADLEQAVELNDTLKLEQLLDTLETITDKGSAYYLKLKAFQMIRAEQYARARAYLNLVLKKDATDLDAGLNMAIIDIRENARSAARERLIKLREQYPAHPVIDRLLSQL